MAFNSSTNGTIAVTVPVIGEIPFVKKVTTKLAGKVDDLAKKFGKNVDDVGANLGKEIDDMIPPKGGGVDNCNINKSYSSNEANDWWKKEKGYDNPPYKPDTDVSEIRLTANTKFVRVYDVEIPLGTNIRTGIANKVSGWGDGEGIQYDLIGQTTGKFGNQRPLK